MQLKLVLYTNYKMLYIRGTLLIFVLICSFSQIILGETAEDMLFTIGEIYKKKVKENNQLHQDLEQANQKLLAAAKLQEEYNALKEKTDILSQNELSAQNKISELQNSLLRKEQHWISVEETHRREIQQKLQEYKQLHQDLEQANQKLMAAARLQEEYNALKEKIAILSQNELSAQHKISELQNTLSQNEITAQNKISELQNTLMRKEQHWISVEETHRREIQQWELKVSQISSRFESISLKLDEEKRLKIEIQQLFTEYKIKQQRKETEFHHELERCQASKREIYQKVTTLEYNVSQSSIIIQTLESKLREEEQYKIRMEQKITEIKILYENKAKECSLEQESCKAYRIECEQRIRQFQLNITESSITIVNLSKKLESVVKINIDIQSSLNVCEKESKNLINNNDQCKAHQLEVENEIHDLTIKIENLSITINKITKISNDAQNENKRLLVLIQECKNDQEELRVCKRNEITNSRICNENEERLRVEINELRVKVTVSLQNINTLNVQLQNENQQNIQLQKLLSQCKNEISTINIKFQQQWEICEQKYERYEQEVRQLTIQINQCKILPPSNQYPKYLTIIVDAREVVTVVRKILEKVLGHYVPLESNLNDIEKRNLGLLIQAKSRILVYESRLVTWLGSATSEEQGVNKIESRIEELFKLLHLKLKISDSAKWVAQNSNANLKFITTYKKEVNEFEALMNELEALRLQQQSNAKRGSENIKIIFLHSKLKYHQNVLSQLLGSVINPVTSNISNGIRLSERISSNFSSTISRNSTIQIDLDEVSAESCEDGEDCSKRAKKKE